MSEEEKIEFEELIDPDIKIEEEIKRIELLIVSFRRELPRNPKIALSIDSLERALVILKESNK
jgi:hypothetical protein